MDARNRHMNHMCSDVVPYTCSVQHTDQQPCMQSDIHMPELFVSLFQVCGSLFRIMLSGAFLLILLAGQLKQHVLASVVFSLYEMTHLMSCSYDQWHFACHAVMSKFLSSCYSCALPSTLGNKLK